VEARAKPISAAKSFPQLGTAATVEILINSISSRNHYKEEIDTAVPVSPKAAANWKID